ncbi:MAG: hypothetical protein QF814_00120, partial [Candidatus Marinimicrobia bacterium]|nr:hypothetical protein [Candidatus Neomarinimicrobiota bacterium]
MINRISLFRKQLKRIEKKIDDRLNMTYKAKSNFSRFFSFIFFIASLWKAGVMLLYVLSVWWGVEPPSSPFYIMNLLIFFLFIVLHLYFTYGIFPGYDGLWTSWYSDGQKKEEGASKDGEKDGLWTSWWNNPIDEYEPPIWPLARQLWTFWWNTGQKKEEGTYKNGKKDGLWTTWYSDGKKEEEGTYKNGK